MPEKPEDPKVKLRRLAATLIDSHVRFSSRDPNIDPNLCVEFMAEFASMCMADAKIQAIADAKADRIHYKSQIASLTYQVTALHKQNAALESEINKPKPVTIQPAEGRLFRDDERDC